MTGTVMARRTLEIDFYSAGHVLAAFNFMKVDANVTNDIQPKIVQGMAP